MSPHIFLVAGEESGDRLGASLVEAIRQRTHVRCQFSAVGGAHMAAAGVPSLFPLGDLAIIGFAAIPASLPKILRRIRETGDAGGGASLFPLGDLAIIGFAAIPASLPKILRRIRETADAVVSAKPDALIIIDSPGFTHRVAQRVRARASDIPIIDYVCPSVWAWRAGRARSMWRYVDHVLAL